MKPDIGQIWQSGGNYYKIINKAENNRFLILSLQHPFNTHINLTVDKEGNVVYKDTWNFIKNTNKKCERCKII